MLGQEVYIHISRDLSSPNYTHAGFLGITFFMMAFLGQVLAAKVQKSEALAEQRAIDLENMGVLNEYIVQRMKSGLIVLDDEYRIRLFNEAAKQLLGLEESHNIVLKYRSPELFGYLNDWDQNDGQRIVIFRPVKGDIDIQIGRAHV